MDRCVVFPKSRFPDFFAVMRSFGTVYAPVRVSEQSFSFKEVNAPNEIAFEALRTILPPKKFFFREHERILAYSEDGIKEVRPTPAPQVLFGLHPCDLAGLGIMDKIFLNQPEDTHYSARRKSSLLVGLSCLPDKYCFCKSMETDSPSSNYDLFLTDLDGHYFVQIDTANGLTLVESDRDLFSRPTVEQKQAFKNFWTSRQKAFERGFESENLPAIVDMEWENKVWDDLGNRCLSCGNCTFVCPSCYCFDMIDIASLHADRGERVREWDSCQLVGFAKVAGDYNFRPGPVDRLKFWYRHKLHGFEDPYVLPTCVGCGRCTTSCPSGIDDIVNVVLRLQGKPSVLITDKGEKGSACQKGECSCQSPPQYLQIGDLRDDGGDANAH